MIYTLLENHAFVPGLIFICIVYFCPGTNEGHLPVGATALYKCPLVQVCWGLLLPPGTNVLTSHLHRAEPLPSINVVTFVPGKKKTWYKCHSINPAGRT
jgi:hypothetical protein